MTTAPAPVRSRRVMPETWPSIAIGVIWLVVLVDALVGPDILVNNANGFTRFPSAIILMVFAWLATRAIAKRAFRQPADRAG